MKLPNHERAVIESDKLTEYLLNVDHKRGVPKARLLAIFGFHAGNWQELETEIRRNLETYDVEAVRATDYGIRYEVLVKLVGPTGRELQMRSIWQVDEGTDYPRFITMYPR